MSMDDPGWGSSIPGPGESGPPTQATLPPDAAAGDGGGTKPPRSGPKGAVLASAVVVGVAIVAAVALVRSSGSGSKARVATNTTSTTRVTAAASTSPAPTTVPLSKADYIVKADNICLAYRSQIQSALTGSDLAMLAQVSQMQLDELRSLGDPAQDAALIRSALNDLTQAINFWLQNDAKGANPLVLSADTKAGQFGLKVCNYGH
jgi:hypothetical protein